MWEKYVGVAFVFTYLEYMMAYVPHMNSSNCSGFANETHLI
jgi:hypothetical protein